MREKMEKWLNDQMLDIIDDLEQILEHCEDERYERDEVADELRDLISRL